MEQIGTAFMATHQSATMLLCRGDVGCLLLGGPDSRGLENKVWSSEKPQCITVLPVTVLPGGQSPPHPLGRAVMLSACKFNASTPCKLICL